MRWIKCFVVAATVALVCVNTAHASTIGVTIEGGESYGSFSEHTVIGWEFTANQNVTVDSLGMWDEYADGFKLGGSTEVGLWISGGTLLASTVVSSSDPLSGINADGGFRFSPIAGANLTAGNNYVVAGLLAPNDWYRFYANITNSPAITWGESRAVDTNVLTFPTEFTDWDGAWFGGNLTYTTVPEPSTLLLLGTGLAMVGLKRRRQKL